jgi:hypothetical protein
VDLKRGMFDFPDVDLKRERTPAFVDRRNKHK